MTALIVRIAGVWLLYIMGVLVLMIICLAVKIRLDDRRNRRFEQHNEQ